MKIQYKWLSPKLLKPLLISLNYDKIIYFIEDENSSYKNFSTGVVDFCNWKICNEDSENLSIEDITAWMLLPPLPSPEDMEQINQDEELLGC